MSWWESNPRDILARLVSSACSNDPASRAISLNETPNLPIRKASVDCPSAQLIFSYDLSIPNFLKKVNLQYNLFYE